MLCYALQESVSPVLWTYCNQILLAFKSTFPRVSQSLCQSPKLGNLFLSLELSQQCKNIWDNYSPVCRSSAQQLYSGANGNLLQGDLRYMPHLPGLLQPEPLCPQQVTADPYLCWRHSDTQRQVWLSLLRRSLLPSLGPGEHKSSLEPSENI